MASAHPEPAEADRLSPTGKPRSARRMLKIVLILVVAAHAIAGLAWLAGNLIYKQDYGQMRTMEPDAAQAPARPAAP